MESQDWKIKYQPKSFDEMILPDEFKVKMKSIQANLHQNYLFSGQPGKGKTLSSEILAVGHERVIVKCSVDGSVDRIRRLSTCSGRLLDGDKRVIILDEVDNLKGEAGVALRGLMDELSIINVFILTANEPNKLNRPLLSRVTEIEFDYEFDTSSAKQMKDRILSILKEESIDILDVKALNEVVNKNKFDYRKLLGEVQSLALEWKYREAA